MDKFWKWQDIKAKNITTDEEETQRTLILDGVIACESWFDDEVSPQEFKDDLCSGEGDITVWINSPGGDCIAAAQIYNMLKEYDGRVSVKVDGIAASAASVIAMAGDKVYMSPVSMMMIHNPSTMAWGDRAELKKAMSMLDEVKESIINAYEIKTGLSRNKISNLMDAETWMNAGKATELGFADATIKDISMQDFVETAPASAMFSQAQVVNSLMDKIAKKCKIEQEQKKTTGLNVADAKARLDIIKKFI